jgi:hypothetical protein
MDGSKFLVIDRSIASRAASDCDFFDEVSGGIAGFRGLWGLFNFGLST